MSSTLEISVRSLFFPMCHVHPFLNPLPLGGSTSATLAYGAYFMNHLQTPQRVQFADMDLSFLQKNNYYQMVLLDYYRLKFSRSSLIRINECLGEECCSWRYGNQI